MLEMHAAAHCQLAYIQLGQSMMPLSILLATAFARRTISIANMHSSWCHAMQRQMLMICAQFAVLLHPQPIPLCSSSDAYVRHVTIDDRLTLHLPVGTPFMQADNGLVLKVP